MPGALARKRRDPAKEEMGKHGTLGAKVAPFPSERRALTSDLPTLSEKCSVGWRAARKFT